MLTMPNSPDRGAPGYRYTRTAGADIAGILRYTTTRFGRRQRLRYAELIDRAAEMIAEDPMQPGSRQRGEVAPGVRSFHVELAGRSRGAAAHVLYYIEQQQDDGNADVLILRVLHERMDPIRHILQEP